MHKYRLTILQEESIKDIECNSETETLEKIKEYMDFEWAEPFGKSIDSIIVERIYIESDDTSSISE